MRTKEEVLQKLPTDLTEIEKYEGSNNIEVRVRVGILEALLDIRDLFDGAINEHFGYTQAEKTEEE